VISGPIRCVADASVGIKLILPERLSDRAEALFSQLDNRPRVSIYVPDLFFIESANGLWNQARRFNRPPELPQRGLDRLRNLALERFSTYQLAAAALQIALAHGSTAYDSCYVALGALLGVPLITADAALVRRFAATGYEVIWLGDPSLALA
jgi:predicted nucleic acid-binding protein